MNQYQQFYQLHHRAQPFVLANAWNAASARAAEAKGFDAIGTSGGAIADSLGYPDGEQMPFPELLYIVKRIRSAVSIPLSVDMERGYTNDMDELNAHIQQLLNLGVAGINLEDAQGEEIFARKLSSIRQYLASTGQQLFINARTDAFLQKMPAALETTLKRAATYQALGADGLFVTGIGDTGTIRAITLATTLPVNIVATPPLAEPGVLADCGVKRISMAAFLYRYTYRQAAAAMEQVKSGNSLSALHQ